MSFAFPIPSIPLNQKAAPVCQYRGCQDQNRINGFPIHIEVVARYQQERVPVFVLSQQKVYDTDYWEE